MRSSRLAIQMSKRLVILNTVVLAIVVLVTYYPATKIGFVNNDWIYLDRVARWSAPQYLFHYLVPGAESGWYRPLFGIYFLVVYSLFGGNSTAYHWGYVLLHLTNAMLLFALVNRISSKYLIALAATLLYVGLPAYSKAVYWPSTPDTLAMVFYLGALWFWIDYLKTLNPKAAYLTYAAVLLAFLTKETSMTLPVALLLIDRMVIRDRISVVDLVRRYTPYVLVWIPYLGMEFALQKSGSYVSMAGYGFGGHIILNLLNSLVALALPWRFDTPLDYVALVMAAAMFLWITLWKKSKIAVFLGSMIILNLVPVIGFPSQWFELRYLYGVAMAASILWVLGLYWSWKKWGKWKAYAVLASSLIAVTLITNGVGTAEAIADWGEIARQRAVPFRDITRNHPAFPNPTKIYFIDSQTTSVYDLSVMFLMRYGAGVIVDGTDDNQSNRLARLRETTTSYVYYFDATGKPIEIRVAQNDPTYSTLALPVAFDASIRLEGYEIAGNTFKPGDKLVLFLYWRTTKKIEKPYAVFVHLVSDSEPSRVLKDLPSKTTVTTDNWQTNTLIVDPIILPIPKDAPTRGNYHLEVGLYSLEDGTRLPVLGSTGASETDHVTIKPFWMIE